MGNRQGREERRRRSEARVETRDEERGSRRRGDLLREVRLAVPSDDPRSIAPTILAKRARAGTAWSDCTPETDSSRPLMARLGLPACRGPRVTRSVARGGIKRPGLSGPRPARTPLWRRAAAFFGRWTRHAGWPAFDHAFWVVAESLRVNLDIGLARCRWEDEPSKSWHGERLDQPSRRSG